MNIEKEIADLKERVDFIEKAHPDKLPPETWSTKTDKPERPEMNHPWHPKEEQPEGYKHIKCEKGYGVECPKCKTVFNYRRQKVGGGVQTCPSCGHGAKPSQWRVVEYRESPPEPSAPLTPDLDRRPDPKKESMEKVVQDAYYAGFREGDDKCNYTDIQMDNSWLSYSHNIDFSYRESPPDDTPEKRDRIMHEVFKAGTEPDTPESKDQRIAELEESDESMKEILRRNIATTEKAEAERDRALRRSEKYCLDLGEKETTVTELRARLKAVEYYCDAIPMGVPSKGLADSIKALITKEAP